MALSTAVKGLTVFPALPNREVDGIAVVAAALATTGAVVVVEVLEPNNPVPEAGADGFEPNEAVPNNEPEAADVELPKRPVDGVAVLNRPIDNFIKVGKVKFDIKYQISLKIF